MKKYLLGLLLALSMTSVSAFSVKECNIAAVNIFYAQSILNEDAEEFKKATEDIKKAPASKFEWTESLKTYILGIATSLKAGNDPQKVGQTVYDSCVKQKSV